MNFFKYFLRPYKPKIGQTDQDLCDWILERMQEEPDKWSWKNWLRDQTGKMIYLPNGFIIECQNDAVLLRPTPETCQKTLYNRRIIKEIKEASERVINYNVLNSMKSDNARRT